MELKDKIIKLLKETEEPLKSGEIAEKLNVDKKEVDKIIKKLKKEDLIFSPIRCKYKAK